MKILIVSDTHRSRGNFEKAVEKERPLDMLIHLGDAEGDEDYLEAVAGCPSHILRGNNDFFSELPGEEEFFLEGHHVFITHGHYYCVSIGEERLKEEARGRGADVVMYGHTHRPALTIEEDLVTVNPGSIAYPRQEGRRGSYVVMNIGSDGKVFYEQKFL